MGVKTIMKYIDGDEETLNIRREAWRFSLISGTRAASGAALQSIVRSSLLLCLTRSEASYVLVIMLKDFRNTRLLLLTTSKSTLLEN